MKNFDTRKRLILGVTACPAGIAHTYMAAESLEKAGRKLNVKVRRTEKQRANGIEGRFTNEELAKAEANICSYEVAIKGKGKIRRNSEHRNTCSRTY